MSKEFGPDFSYETALHKQGFIHIAGVDEVGRGPIAGPVTAGAVILDPTSIPTGLNDSKKLTKKARSRLNDEIKATAYFAIGWASEAEIDTLNILKASHLAMRRALEALPIPTDFALIDGSNLPASLPCPAQAIIKGDCLSFSISAASIIAKCARDDLMQHYATLYPNYGWQTNVGYPTKAHQAALKTYGVTQYHRKTFAPVHNILRLDLD